MLRSGSLTLVRGRIVPLEQITPRLVDAWAELATRATEPNPCHEPEFFLSAVRHLRAPDSLALAVCGDESRIDACLPVWRGRYWKRLPLQTIRTWQHPYAFLGAPLLDGADPAGAGQALITLLADSHRGDLLVLDDCPVGEGLHSGLAVAAQRCGTRVHADRPYQRAAILDTTDAIGLRGKHVKDLRRMRRRLEEKLDARLTVADLSADTATVAAFLDLEASGWKGAGGSALACAHEAFFRSMCDEAALGERIRFLSLQADGRAVAMLCVLQSGGHRYWFKTAYDERLATYSPGRQLMIEATTLLNTPPASGLVDSCADPDNETINRMWTGRRRLATLLVPLPGRTRSPIDALAAMSTRRHSSGEAG
ncbi:CelD/BcsL family acetyltransferase involved in cellulose biosynthesis [Mycolicibacterium sp. 624]